MPEEVETGKKSSERGKSEKPRDRHNRRERTKPQTKVIIRHLPPTMSEEDFLKQIDPLPDHEHYYYVPADWSLGLEATCRAYITFTKTEDVYLFRDRFDGYVFVDTKGAEYPAVVEYAPFQGLPKNRSRKKDVKANTIESDQHYIAFLEKLQNEENEPKPDMKLEFSLQLKDEKKITSTPLLEYLADKKQARRDDRKKRTEEKRRNRDDDRVKAKIQFANKIPPSIKEEDNKSSGAGGGDGGGRENKDREKPRDERRDRPRGDEQKTRSQIRRDERNQRRREERQQKNAERNKGNRDRVEAKPSTSQNIAAEKPKTPPKVEVEENKRREVRKYSERRDKMRLRNEPKENAASRKEPDLNATPSTSVPEINETVKNFIENVAKIKEFIPKGKDTALPKLESVEAIEKKEIAVAAVETEIEETLNEEKTETQPAPKEYARSKSEEIGRDSIENTAQPDLKASSSERLNERESGSSANGEKKEDRNAQRVRNKDRPSLQIYQPKIRTIWKPDDGGRSSAEPKDIKSNPTSDCENFKKEEKIRKRISSSRRSSIKSNSRSNPTSDCENAKKDDKNRSSAEPTSECESAAKVEEKNRKKEPNVSSRRASVDIKSNPTSDGESLKKNQHGTKKVFRYSERRSSRMEKIDGVGRYQKLPEDTFIDSRKVNTKQIDAGNVKAIDSEIKTDTKLDENIESIATSFNNELRVASDTEKQQINASNEGDIDGSINTDKKMYDIDVEVQQINLSNVKLANIHDNIETIISSANNEHSLVNIEKKVDDIAEVQQINVSNVKLANIDDNIDTIIISANNEHSLVNIEKKVDDIDAEVQQIDDNSVNTDKNIDENIEADSLKNELRIEDNVKVQIEDKNVKDIVKLVNTDNEVNKTIEVTDSLQNELQVEEKVEIQQIASNLISIDNSINSDKKVDDIIVQVQQTDSSNVKAIDKSVDTDKKIDETTEVITDALKNELKIEGNVEIHQTESNLKDIDCLVKTNEKVDDNIEAIASSVYNELRVDGNDDALKDKAIDSLVNTEKKIEDCVESVENVVTSDIQDGTVGGLANNDGQVDDNI